MLFHGWLPRSSHELTARTTKCDEKYTSPCTRPNRLHHLTSIKRLPGGPGKPSLASALNSNSARNLRVVGAVVRVVRSQLLAGRRARGHGESPEWRVQLLVHLRERDEARAFLQSLGTA